ncbi:cyanophycinase [Thalassotalea aquiviva]|uniref:cyanophycinase n=1 Tax=Thalassotalea aquiviva TaxID=3242415 RepID=UPI00352B2F8B
MNQSQCEKSDRQQISPSTSELKQGKSGPLFKVNNSKIEQLRGLLIPHYPAQYHQGLLSLLKQIKKHSKQASLSKNQLRSYFKQFDLKGMIPALSDPEYYLLLDVLEVAVVDTQANKRLKEKVFLTQSKDSHSVFLYQEFVRLAGKKSKASKPNILVLTASARDPFEAADFYQQAFTQAGANAYWLPLDATLQAVWQMDGDLAQHCQRIDSYRLKHNGSYNRQAVYPDLVEKQINTCLNQSAVKQLVASVDGIFINGGDQSLTNKAFKNNDGSDSEILSIIKQRLAQNNILIGGTSAGTAVMSGASKQYPNTVMITNGRSEDAIFRGAKADVLPTEGCQKSNRCDLDLRHSDLTYNSTGGLGLFDYGILDTHFSERGRQGRLAVLTKHTGAKYAFGVDEATALVVSKNNTNQSIQLDVLGKAGVFIIENSVMDKQDQLTTHYLTAHDFATLASNKLTMTFADIKQAVPKSAQQTTEVTDNIFSQTNYQQWANRLCLGEFYSAKAAFDFKQQRKEITLSSSANFKASKAVISAKQPSDERQQPLCSYQNLALFL